MPDLASDSESDYGGSACDGACGSGSGDDGFYVDFRAGKIYNGEAVFSFFREGKQYIIREDGTGTLDTCMACGVQHDPPPRDKTDWKFEDTGPHFDTHGPFDFELFAAVDNHFLPMYYTTRDSCVEKDWAGKACYGNPPFEHDTHHTTVPTEGSTGPCPPTSHRQIPFGLAQVGNGHLVAADQAAHHHT
ncbi:hypothetical protein CYMTET_6097 [Cymbomonas tetramitiformis]|uniref:Uncharacterized protein n=1 Tax=Cymbomonas tetramitiformis TaxID=36881 RepID=A0AAE0GY61_9CHLO|nr:hypothetical protein CYMTET_6097 [Cymbomonas tetramitiformis]|eukprot:gene34040-biopygen5799